MGLVPYCDGDYRFVFVGNDRFVALLENKTADQIESFQKLFLSCWNPSENTSEYELC